ncbi:hypothetical protein GBAR_LOCUS31369 [Geodia barretti]|uniref:BAR domain-containing protein n=1 Tax=Geodia barretti TaxID=519541 RepID=A0AA35TZV0_GEOBA|nr:hypothetical protein GBAR_LOCUS31369 [Geodia barretti]
MGQGDGQDESGGEGGSQAGSTGSRKLIDLRDCLTDSPRFRHRLADHEAEVVDLESKLEKVSHSCTFYRTTVSRTVELEQTTG